MIVHTHCDQCKKNTDGLMTCTYSHDGSTTELCPDCIKDSGFCLRCGHYSSGKESFDFSDMPGYCDECREEIKAADDDDFMNDCNDDESEIIGYHCMGCGHTQSTSGECNRCTAHDMEEMYF